MSSSSQFVCKFCKGFESKPVVCLLLMYLLVLAPLASLYFFIHWNLKLHPAFMWVMLTYVLLGTSLGIRGLIPVIFILSIVNAVLVTPYLVVERLFHSQYLIWGSVGFIVLVEILTATICYKTLLTIFGVLKYFESQPVIVHDPSSYRVSGSEYWDIMEHIKPGDILLRAYEGFLDGWFIRRTYENGYEGTFTHAAIFVGDVNYGERNLVAAEVKGEAAKKEGLRFFDSCFPNPQSNPVAKQMVVHSMAIGVHMQDILTWSRCDYMVILRLPDPLNIKKRKIINLPSPRSNSLSRRLHQMSRLVRFSRLSHNNIQVLGVTPQRLNANEERIDKDLNQNVDVSRDVVVKEARMHALGKMGTEYDFSSNDKSFHTMSCVELVFYCYRSISRYLGLARGTHSVFGLRQRDTLAPDDFLKADLELVWQSQSLTDIGWKHPGGKQPLYQRQPYNITPSTSEVAGNPAT